MPDVIARVRRAGGVADAAVFCIDPNWGLERIIGHLIGLGANDLTTIVAKVDAIGPSKYVTDLSLLENRFAFQRWLATPAAAPP